MASSSLRRLGRTDIFVSSVAMGCWPIAGVSSLEVTDESSMATLEAALDSGINFFDTAYVYGYTGESERLIGKALGHRRDEIVIASKGGIEWGPDKKQIRDARPKTIKRQCEESLQRLGTEAIDLYYLHAPDGKTPLAEAAGAFRELLQEGKVLSVGVSNFEKAAQYEEFHAVCQISADQPQYNMLQREIEAETAPWCVAHGVSVMVYWPLMKGILAGKMQRDHQFDPKDKRLTYPLYQGEEWQKTHDFLDKLRPIAEESGKTLAQLAIAWVIQRPGITSALCGAKRPEQIRETAVAMDWTLTPDQLARIDQAIAERGSVPLR